VRKTILTGDPSGPSETMRGMRITGDQARRHRLHQQEGPPLSRQGAGAGAGAGGVLIVEPIERNIS
jgi:hypothetical protein